MNKSEIESNLKKCIEIPIGDIISIQKNIVNEAVNIKQLNPDYIKICQQLNLIIK